MAHRIQILMKVGYNRIKTTPDTYPIASVSKVNEEIKLGQYAPRLRFAVMANEIRIHELNATRKQEQLQEKPNPIKKNVLLELARPYSLKQQVQLPKSAKKSVYCVKICKINLIIKMAN